jgi:class 3 adenylate cyclase
MRLASRVSGRGRIHGASVPLTAAGFSQGERRATFPFREAVPAFRAILFADLAGFGALPGDHYLAFYEALHQLLSRAIETAGERPILDTWGDGVHATFGDVVAAARFAWALCGLAAREDWPVLGMPAATNFRVALGAGTVLTYRDPLLDRLVCRGPAITHAARIEPITPPGSIWTSRPFAAWIESTPRHDFACRPLGRKTLAKGRNRHDLYLLSRESEGSLSVMEEDENRLRSSLALLDRVCPMVGGTAPGSSGHRGTSSSLTGRCRVRPIEPPEQPAAALLQIPVGAPPPALDDLGVDALDPSPP